MVHVVDSNHCYINILSHQNLRRSITTDCDKFLNFDIELQMFFANPANIKFVDDTINIQDTFAFKDIETSIYKR